MSSVLLGHDALLFVRLCSPKWSQTYAFTIWPVLHPNVMHTCMPGTFCISSVCLDLFKLCMYNSIT